MKTSVFRLLIPTLGLAILACSGDPTGVTQGTFSAAISGDLSKSISGGAIFGMQSGTAGDQWVLFLAKGNFNTPNFDIITFGREDLTRPAEGEYELGDARTGAEEPPGPTDFVGAYSFGDEGDIGVFVSISGTLTITASTDAEISGSYNFELRQSFGTGAIQALVITGTFRAESGTIPQ